MPRLLEVCVDSFESAMAAIAGGAHRLELCSSLTDGGLTPTPGMLTAILNANPGKIPVFCLIRCRAGDFVYTPEEMDVMKEDTKVLRNAGADGFVFGALSENDDVDMKNCREIVKAAFPLSVTFSRAFDFCRRPTIEIEVLIDLGFARVLTSGKQPNAHLGSRLIERLVEQVDRRIIVVAGGGITVENFDSVIAITQATEYHGSFRSAKPEKPVAEGEEKIHLGANEGPLYVTDPSLLARALELLKITK